ncbi:hypothetical protein [Mycobacterium angelicum]|nr:hypothetical protein [Mycobacterium angelicum]MCV7194950.1 hypothetical protein [Mycobacterium angelicum]
MGTVRSKRKFTVRVLAGVTGAVIAATTLTGCNGRTVAPDHVVALSR